MDNGFYNQNMNQKTPEFTKYLVLSILEMICCCPITGIIALICTILADSDFKKGDIMNYQQKLKSAKISLIVGLVLGVVATVIIIFVYSILGVALLSQH